MVVILVIDDTELTRGDTMDRGLGMDGVGVGGCLFQRAGEVFGGVTDFKCNVRAQPLGRLGDRRKCDRLGDRCQPVDVVDGEVGFVGGGGVVAVGDVEDVVGDVFFDDEPGTTREAHAFALTDGVEPEAFVLTDTTTSFEFDDITGVFTEVTSDIVIVIDLPQKTDALGVLALGIDKMLPLGNLPHLILDIMTNREDCLPQLPVVDLREEVGLILYGVWTGDEPLPTCLINLRLGIMARGNEVVVMPDPSIRDDSR